MDQAIAQYPYLKDKNIGFVNNPMPDKSYLESWPPNEEGSKNWLMRPPELPMGQFGIQNLSEETTPTGLLADYVSHWATNQENPNRDAVLSDAYSKFAASVDEKKLRSQYGWLKENGKEKRPFEQWAQSSGIPAAFRGYTFNQWPKNFNDKYYSPQQIKLLDGVRNYLGVTNEK